MVGEMVGKADGTRPKLGDPLGAKLKLGKGDGLALEVGASLPLG